MTANATADTIEAHSKDTFPCERVMRRVKANKPLLRSEEQPIRTSSVYKQLMEWRARAVSVIGAAVAGAPPDGRVEEDLSSRRCCALRR